MSNKGVLAVLGAASVVGIYAAWRETKKAEQVEISYIQPAGQLTGGSKAKLAAWEAAQPKRSAKDALIGWGVETLFGAIENGGWLDGLGGKKGGSPATSGGWVRDQVPGLPSNTNSAPGASGTGIGKRLVNDLMADFGFTKPQAAGVVGNLDHESDGFKGLQEYNPTVAGSRGGYGYAQWTGPRRRQFEAWAAEQGHSDLSTYEANYGFLKYEMTQTWEKRAVDRVKRTSTAAESARVFQDTFLRPGIPHTSSRIKRAEGYL